MGLSSDFNDEFWPAKTALENFTGTTWISEYTKSRDNRPTCRFTFIDLEAPLVKKALDFYGNRFPVPEGVSYNLSPGSRSMPSKTLTLSVAKSLDRLNRWLGRDKTYLQECLKRAKAENRIIPKKVPGEQLWADCH